MSKYEFPTQMTVIGWNALEYPLEPGSIIQVGVKLPEAADAKRREAFTVFTMPYVDELKLHNRELLDLVKDCKRYLESVEEGIPPGAPIPERFEMAIAKAEGTPD